MTGGRRALVATLAAIVAVLSLAAPAAAAKAKSKRPLVEIRRTAYGVPHVKATNWRGLGYGYGYAFVRDNVCTIAESYVTVSAERSRWFGPDATWDFRSNGTKPNNLNSDFFYKAVNESGIVERLTNLEPPHGPRRQIKEMVRGYVAGYNEWLRRRGGSAGINDPRCRGKEWVRPITELDVYRRFYQLASLASQGVAIDGIGDAKPATGPAAGQAQASQADAIAGLQPDSLRLPIGSNAYGLGKDATDNGRGMVLGNPHFPWSGPERLYQAQLTIPGRIDVSGGSLYGVPLVLIGTTRGLSWSHTVATAYRFTPIELELAPGDPYSYVVDGRAEKMQERTVTVDVRTADGRIEQRTRKLYRTRYGPMFTSLLGLPLFPWTSERGYAMHDANEENFRYLNHFFDNNRAQTVRQYDAIQRRYQGIPWVNSIAADASGEAYYSMDGAIPNVPNDLVAACGGELNRATFTALGLPVLDGSRSACDWRTDDDAVAPGIFGPSHVPRLFRNDYTHNGNDSHWLTNPHQPLTGFARIIGNEGTERTLRTRLGLVQLEERLGGGGKFGFDAFKATLTDDRQYAGELWRDELVRMCRELPVAVGTSGPVDVSEACPVLERWDLRDDPDSRGAVLFRRFATRVLSPSPAGAFGRAYDPADPVNTPRGLNTASPQVRAALADAVSDLRGAGIPLDAPLGNHQYVERGGQKIPIPGGPGTLGVFNAINVSWSPPAGYGTVPHGSSFVMATRFTGGRCPVRTETFVTYGESENPESPHNSDYTRAFSEERWNRVPFCEREIARAPGLRVTRLRLPR
jgi:acyl-homoserine-lactone acylase